jgi:hypothetical protein
MARTFRIVAALGLVLTLAALVGLPSMRHGEAAAPGSSSDALVVLSTLDMDSFHKTIAAVRSSGGEVLQAYPPNAFVATLDSRAELALRKRAGVARIERGVA